MRGSEDAYLKKIRTGSGMGEPWNSMENGNQL